MAQVFKIIFILYLRKLGSQREIQGLRERMALGDVSHIKLTTKIRRNDKFLVACEMVEFLEEWTFSSVWKIDFTSWFQLYL